ncbi:MAG: hypothetical protein IJ887_01365 [Prevotella sp.]|nr:hypothetical protein [Prevotella sp.]
MTWTFRLSDLYLIRKERLAIMLFYVGMLIAFLGSMHPWFLWPLGTFYPLVAAMFTTSSLMVSNTMAHPVFCRKDFFLPLMAFFMYAAYECMSTGSNVNAYIMLLFKGAFYFSLFTLDPRRLSSLATFIAKVMGALLAASLAGFFLYLLGFPLPGSSVQFGEFYSFTNYYLFLLDDRNLFAIVPRFQAYFPEPSHVGSAAAFLLFAQRGHWRKWYNLMLIATIAFSFSLGAYVYLTAIIFLNLWIEKKAMFRKLAIVIAIFVAGIAATFTYNGGNNLVHDLILLRLEMDDGELAGDNRVTGNFEKDYENFIGSGDVVFGRSYDRSVEFGNAGYKVFFYDHGLVGVILIFAFYFIAFRNAANKRAAVSALIVAGLYFLPSAFMLLEKVIVPLYAAAYCDGTAIRQEPIPADSPVQEIPA